MRQILELDITLRDAKPKIWRRLLVDSSMNFLELHYAIQFGMGWTNSHLHQFLADRGNRYIGIPHEDDMMDIEDGRNMKIGDLLRAPKDKIIYEYDFGDGWEHVVEVKKVHAPEAGKKYPTLIGGKGACPPEDCGGVWGYADLLETMKKPGTKAYKEMAEWLGLEEGETFDPEAFDFEDVNKTLFDDFKNEVKEWDELMGW